MTQASEAPVRLLSSTHSVQFDIITLMAPQRIYSIDQCGCALLGSMPILFAICAKSISSLNEIDDSKTSCTGWAYGGGYPPLWSLKLLKPKEIGIKRRGRMRQYGRALILALRVSGVQMTCACRAD